MPFAVSYLLFYSFLECQTFSAPVFQLNDTAIGIAELVQQTLHGLVVRVRVDADVAALLHAPVMQNEAAPCVLCRRDTVDNAVRRIVQPGAAANDAVGRSPSVVNAKVAAILPLSSQT